MAAFLPVLFIVLTQGASQLFTSDERATAIHSLESSEKAFLASLANVTDAQWDFRPAPTDQTVAEVAGSVARNEDAMRELIKKLAASEFVPTKGARRQDDEVVQMARERVPNLRSPGGIAVGRAGVAKRFQESRRRTIAFVRNTRVDLRLRFQPHPVYGTLDTYQWILVLSAQTERDTARLNELKLLPGYPRK